MGGEYPLRTTYTHTHTYAHTHTHTHSQTQTQTQTQTHTHTHTSCGSGILGARSRSDKVSALVEEAGITGAMATKMTKAEWKKLLGLTGLSLSLSLSLWLSLSVALSGQLLPKDPVALDRDAGFEASRGSKKEARAAGDRGGTRRAVMGEFYGGTRRAVMGEFYAVLDVLPCLCLCLCLFSGTIAGSRAGRPNPSVAAGRASAPPYPPSSYPTYPAARVMTWTAAALAGQSGAARLLCASSRPSTPTDIHKSRFFHKHAHAAAVHRPDLSTLHLTAAKLVCLAAVARATSPQCPPRRCSAGWPR